MKKLRKPTAEMVKKEIEILEKALRNKPWLQAEPSQQRLVLVVLRINGILKLRSRQIFSDRLQGLVDVLLCRSQFHFLFFVSPVLFFLRRHLYNAFLG